MPKFAPEEWQAEQLRLTVFTMPSATMRSAGWWEELTGVQPDESTVKPKSGTGMVQGTWGRGKLILFLEAERMDLMYVPDDVIATVTEGMLPNVGMVSEAFPAFGRIAAAWLALTDFPAISRMAFGGVLVHAEDNRQAGYQRLPDYVPVRVDPESTDFLYQINLPAMPSTSGIPDLQINRLSKWSVSVTFNMGLIMIPAAGSFSGQRHNNLSALRVELDINTVPAFAGQLPQDRLGALLDELMDKARNVAAEGVIPHGT